MLRRLSVQRFAGVERFQRPSAPSPRGAGFVAAESRVAFRKPQRLEILKSDGRYQRLLLREFPRLMAIVLGPSQKAARPGYREFRSAELLSSVNLQYAPIQAFIREAALGDRAVTVTHAEDHARAIRRLCTTCQAMYGFVPRDPATLGVSFRAMMLHLPDAWYMGEYFRWCAETLRRCASPNRSVSSAAKQIMLPKFDYASRAHNADRLSGDILDLAKGLLLAEPAGVEAAMLIDQMQRLNKAARDAMVDLRKVERCVARPQA